MFNNKIISIFSKIRLVCLATLAVFCILRWTNVINWSWAIVLIPLYVFGVAFVIGFIALYVDLRRRHPDDVQDVDKVNDDAPMTS